MTPRNNLSVQIAMRIKEVESTNQHYIYDTVCQSLVHDFIHSNSHMTLVAYGPYNNGKSYTLIGDADSIDTETSKGILPRLVYDLMNRLVILTLKTGVQYLYYVSFIEIYNDIVIDLLNAREETQTSFVLDIDELGYTHIHGVSKVECSNFEDVLRCLRIGLSRRNTKLIDNHVSSLSHVVFTFHVYMLQGGRLAKYNKLIFIDLTSNESENLIEESIHGYNEYYNSSYQIIYDVIANNQFVVPNYFTAIHKFLQDAFNTNIVRKHKNQIDFVSNHMKTVVLCCISNDPLYARDVHNCVSLLSYIYNVYQSGSPVNASEQISKEVFINYLRNKQMGSKGAYGIGDIPGRVVGSSPGYPIDSDGNFLNGVTPLRNGVGGVHPDINVGNTVGGCPNSSPLSTGNQNMNINGSGNNVHCDNTKRNLGFLDGSNIVDPFLENQQYQYQQILGWNAEHQNIDNNQSKSSHSVGHFEEDIPSQVSNQTNATVHNNNRFGLKNPSGLSHNPNVISQHNIDMMNNQLNNLGIHSNFHHGTTTNSSYPCGNNFNANNEPIGTHYCQTNVPNYNQLVPNINRGVPNNHMVPTFNHVTNIPGTQCPPNILSTPLVTPDNHIRAKQNPPGASPCERKTTAIETRKRSTCRPSLSKIDEETDHVEEESEKESSSSETEPDKSERNLNETSSDAYNSSLASNSETNGAVEDGNESLDDVNEDLRSDDEAMCTDSEMCEENGARFSKGEGTVDADLPIERGNKNLKNVPVKSHAGSLPNVNVIEDTSKENIRSDHVKIERVDTENDTSGVFSATVQGLTEELKTEEITDIKTDEIDGIRTDDEVTSEMSEDEEDLLDDTKSIPTSEVGSDEEIALLKQEELQQNENKTQLESNHIDQIRIRESTKPNRKTSNKISVNDKKNVKKQDRTSESEDTEEETDEDEEEHVNELLVKTELDKIYTELEEKIEVLNKNYIQEVFKNDCPRIDNLDAVNHTKYANKIGPQYSDRQGISDVIPSNESSFENSNHPMTRSDSQNNFQHNKAFTRVGFPQSYSQQNGSILGAMHHNLAGVHVNDNLIVQRLSGENQVLNGMYSPMCSNVNTPPRNVLPQCIMSPQQVRHYEMLPHHQRNYQTRAFPSLNPQLYSSHFQSPHTLPIENHCMQKSVSPQQKMSSKLPVNASFVNDTRTGVNTGQLFSEPLTYQESFSKATLPQYYVAPNAHNLAVIQGNTQPHLSRSPPFQRLQNHPSAFQTFVANSTNAIVLNHNKPSSQLQAAIPMVSLGFTHPSAKEYVEMSTNFTSINQHSLLESQTHLISQVESCQTDATPSTNDCGLKTSDDVLKIPVSNNENSQTQDDHKRNVCMKSKSGRTSESDPADSKESGKARKRKSRHKPDSTHSSGDRTNESSSQKGKKNYGKHKGSLDSNRVPFEDQCINSEAVLPQIELELNNKMNSLNINVEPPNTHEDPNASLPKELSNLENINNLAENIANLSIHGKASTSSQSTPSTPHLKPDSFLKRSNSHNVSKKESRTSDPHLDNVLSSCEFQHVWNDIDTKKSQMNVILLDLDTASERINELKQLINLKNHLLKFLVNNKPLRDEVRHKLDTKTVQLKLKLKKLKHDLSEMKHIEEKMTIDKLNSKFKKNRNGGDANKQLILFNQLNRIKHEEEPIVKSSKKLHRKHRHMDRHSNKALKLLDDNEDMFSGQSGRTVNNPSLGSESTLGALVTKYAASNEARLAHETNNTNVYESDDNLLHGHDNTLPTSIASLKAQIEMNDAKLHNLEVITKITMQSDEQIDELNKNLSKWTKILTTFEKLIETEKAKKEQLKNDLVLNLYKIKSMEETFGHDRRNEEVLHDIHVLIDKMKPNHMVVDEIKIEKDVTESDKTIKPESNSSSSTMSKTSEAKVQDIVANKSKDEGRQKSEIKAQEISVKTDVQIHDVPEDCQSQCTTHSRPSCDHSNLVKEPETMNKATNTDTPCVAKETQPTSNLAETSSQTDHEVVSKLPISNVFVESDVTKAMAEQQVIDDYNKEVLRMSKQVNRKSNVIETLMNGSDKKLDNLLETESSIDTLGSTSIRNYKINNSTEISDNAISMAAISDKSAGATPGGGCEKRKKKSSLSRAFSFRKNTVNSTGSGTCPSIERSSDKPAEKEKSTTGKKIKNFILNKSGDKNKSNDSIRFKKPDDQVSNCSNQSSCLKNNGQNPKDDDKLSNSSLASKLRNMVDSNSTRDGKVSVDDKKHDGNVKNGSEQTSKEVVHCSPCCRSSNQTCQCNELSQRDTFDGKVNITLVDAIERAKADREAKRDALKAEIKKLLELKQVIVERRMKLFPSKCQEQSEVSKKLFFEYDESIETIDVLIEYKGNFIRELDSVVISSNEKMDILENYAKDSEKELHTNLTSNPCGKGSGNGQLISPTSDCNCKTSSQQNIIVNRGMETSNQLTVMNKNDRNNPQSSNNNSQSVHGSKKNANHSIHCNQNAGRNNMESTPSNAMPNTTILPSDDSRFNSSNTVQSSLNGNAKDTPSYSALPLTNSGLNAPTFDPLPNHAIPSDETIYSNVVPSHVTTFDTKSVPTNGGTQFNDLYTNLVHKLISLNTNDLIHIVLTYFRRIIDLRSTTIEFEKLVQTLDFKLEMKITNLQEMNLKFERLLQNNQISNEKHLTLLQKDYQNKLHLFYKCYCNDHISEDCSGVDRPQSVSPTAPRADLSETLLLKEENKFLKNRVKFLEAQLRNKEAERGGYEMVPTERQQVGPVNPLRAISSNLTSNKMITVENNKLVISRRK